MFLRREQLRERRKTLRAGFEPVSRAAKRVRLTLFKSPRSISERREEIDERSVRASERVGSPAPWPEFGGGDYCEYHLARDCYHHPDRFDQVQDAVDEDPTALAMGGLR